MLRKDLGGILSFCLLLHLSNTTRLGQAHGHSNLAPTVSGGDAPFRQKHPNANPVLKAYRIRQMDKVGGSVLDPGLFCRHGDMCKMNKNDQISKCTRKVCLDFRSIYTKEQR